MTKCIAHGGGERKKKGTPLFLQMFLLGRPSAGGPREYTLEAIRISIYTTRHDIEPINRPKKASENLI